MAYTFHYNVFCFSVLICHKLSSAVLHLPGEHFPSISSSVTAITSPLLRLFHCQYLANFHFFSCSSRPFSSSTQIFSRTQTLVLYSVQLIRSTRLQDHNENAVILSHFFTDQLSYPCNAMLHTNDLTCCLYTRVYAGMSYLGFWFQKSQSMTLSAGGRSVLWKRPRLCPRSDWFRRAIVAWWEIILRPHGDNRGMSNRQHEPWMSCTDGRWRHTL